MYEESSTCKQNSQNEAPKFEVFSSNEYTEDISAMEWASKRWQKQLKLSTKDQPQRSVESTFDIVLFNNLTGDRLTLPTEMAATSLPTQLYNKSNGIP